MPLTRIRELYVAELSELHEAEEEILRQLPVMAARATDATLQLIFDEHYRDTQRHLTRLGAILDHLDERPRPSAAPAIRGLVEEARLRQALLDRGTLLDLALIDAGRRIEHYEMAAYSALVGYARRLGDGDADRLLRETLEEERHADGRLRDLIESAHVTAA